MSFPDRAGLALLIRGLSNYTEGGLSIKSNRCLDRHHSFTRLVRRTVALLSASRPNLHLGTLLLGTHARSSSTSSSRSLYTQNTMDDTLAVLLNAAIGSPMATPSPAALLPTNLPHSWNLLHHHPGYQFSRLSTFPAPVQTDTVTTDTAPVDIEAPIGRNSDADLAS
jgi:hypothetical protein